MSKYFDNSIEKGISDNLLDNDLLNDNNLALINRNIDIDTKAKLNLNEDITNSNFHKENSRINIEDLF